MKCNSFCPFCEILYWTYNMNKKESCEKHYCKVLMKTLTWADECLMNYTFNDIREIKEKRKLLKRGDFL